VVANPGPGQVPGTSGQNLLASVSFSTALPFGGQYSMPSQSVVAQSGAAYNFTAAVGAVVGGGCCVSFTANGLASAPTFPASWILNSGSWATTVSTQNLLITEFDGYVLWYTWLQPSTTLLPVPTTFSASPGGTSITIDIGGASLDTSVVPPLSAFTMNAVRVAQAGQPIALPAPYALSSISLTSSSVTLGVSGGTFEASDIVTISYQPPFADVTAGQTSTPLQDSSYDYVSAWAAAVVSL
jgi:hypothetical protein